MYTLAFRSASILLLRVALIDEEDDDTDSTNSADVSPTEENSDKDIVYDMMNTFESKEDNFIILNSPPECIVLHKRYTRSSGIYGNLKTTNASLNTLYCKKKFRMKQSNFLFSKICHTPNSRPLMVFNEEKICAACRTREDLKNISWEEREKEF